MIKDNLIRFGASILFLWCLFGCTVGPDFEKPTLYSDKQIEKALELKPKETSKPDVVFKDKVLGKLVKMATENSPTVRIAMQRVKQARLSARIAEVQGLPTFNVSGKYDYMNESRNIGRVLDQDIYQVGIDASWEIDIFGGLRRRSEAAVANAYAVMANLDNVLVSLTAEVILSYVNLRQAQADLSLLKEKLTVQQAVLKHTKSLRVSGLVSEDELNKEQIALQNIKSQIASAKTQIEQAKNQLALLTGQLPKSLDTLLVAQEKSLVTKPLAFNVIRFFEMSADVIENRPDVRAAVYELEAQNAMVGAAIADLYPKVSLSGMLGFASLHTDNLINNKSYAYSVTPALSVPLFYFGQLKNQVKIQREKYTEALANYENTFLTAAGEIKNALVGLQGAEQQYDAAQRSLNEMENIYLLSLQRREAGLINQIDLNEVHLQLLSARETWINANSALYEAVAGFYKSIGAVF